MSVAVKVSTVKSIDSAQSSGVDEPTVNEFDPNEQKLILSKFWIARAFGRVKYLPIFLRDSTQSLNALNEFFELDLHLHKDELEDAYLLSVCGDIKSAFAKAEQDYHKLMASKPAFERNLAYLAEHLGLSVAEQKLLLLTAVASEDNDLEVIENCVNSNSKRKIVEFVSGVIQCKAPDLRKALSSDSMLRQSGLVQQESLHLGGFIDSFVVPSATRRALFSASPNLEDLSSPLVRVAAPAKLSPEHYIGFEKTVSLVTHYLKQTLATRQRGANILLYGLPGTGKTEFARVMAKAIDTILLEVPSQNSSQEPLRGEERISLARQAGRMYKNEPRVLLFDEAEDVFSGSVLSRSIAARHKAWINDLLENCEIPTIWISNNVFEMDAAALRRFDVIVDFDDISHGDRSKQFAQVLPAYVRPELLHTLAAHKPVTVAMAERASTMAQLQVDACGSEFEPAFIEALNNCLKAQLADELPAVGSKQVDFSPEFVRCDEDLLAIAVQLREVKSGRLCLYGPPGTGKSAFGRWLAERLDVPVLVKRGSDLLGKYVGDNERFLAAAFAEAKQQRAILIIDEIDSFLGSRSGHDSSWETQMVNELLIQLESFDGIFVATTNLMGSLDEAAMRRFDMKLHFGYLDSTQCASMLQHVCASLGLKKPSKRDLTAVSALSHLTPGDFALVSRRHRLRPFSSASELVAQLAAETQFKQDSRRIGF